VVFLYSLRLERSGREVHEAMRVDEGSRKGAKTQRGANKGDRE